MLADTLAAQQPTGMAKTSPDADMDGAGSEALSTNGQSKPGNWTGSVPANTQFPPPKTDKPRPHVCATCTRSFARLEHLKRHERSHTKEKPFECPECTRCFARRDLLLRHQQKLHLTATPSSRSRSTRRESTSSSITSAKVRKNSQSTQGGMGSMRPRANTISHIDALGLMGAVQPPPRRRPNAGHNRHASLADFGSLIPSGPRAPQNRMLKINTHGLNTDVGGNLRTAPAFGGFPADMGMDNFFYGGNNTINPAQLHFADSPHSMAFESPASPFPPGYNFGNLSMEDDSANFDWINGFDNQMSFTNAHEHAIAGSSPSAMSGGSPGQGDAMTDSQMHLTPEQWQDSLLTQAPMVPQYDNDWGLSSEMNPDPLSPNSMDYSGPDVKFSVPAFNANSLHPGFPNPLFGFGSQTNSPNTAASVSSGSNRHSSVTSIATDVVTDATRQLLLTLLSQSQSHRKYSQPAVSSPLSPGYTQRPRSAMGAQLPSTADLQRYVNSYINNFHPRLPFLHIPTLNFDPNGTANGSRAKLGFPFPPAISDNGCLLLSMAAIGAQFEFDYGVSKELFDQAKKLIHLYLEERRRADMCAAIGATTNGVDGSTTNTPLWLVQSMLLNVIYGHNCGDRPPADLAATHCAALVGLARAAGLTKASDPMGAEDVPMNTQSFDETTWFAWKVKEERKRTLYSIFVVSSVLVSLYNFPPSLTNSEIGLELPCEENLWGAETPSAWIALGATAAADHGVPFAKALSSLLTTSQRHPLQAHQLLAQNRPSLELPPAQFFTSSFGCLILINALHNYIWETRQRHLGRQWTTQEMEAMQAHIGPAILAYQAVLRDSSNRSDTRANGQTSTNLTADCTPFLDLAFVRLFLALGKAKESFWGRDWDTIAREIASGCDILTRTSSASSSSPDSNRDLAEAPTATKDASTTNGEPKVGADAHYSAEKSSRRERHLRKAAAHAAHSLHTADAQGISLADFPSREVNLGSAICTLECSEILAEWVAVLQERVGRYVGLLGQGDKDSESVPNLMLLETEDTALLQKTETIVRNAENKLDTFQAAARPDQTQGMEEKKYGALASRLLKVAARECDGAATWSVMNLMARNLEAQAEQMEARAEKSLLKTE